MSDSPDLRTTLAALGLTQTGAARLIDVPPRTMRRWVAEPETVPRPIWRLLGLMDIEGVRQRLMDTMATSDTSRGLAPGRRTESGAPAPAG